VTLILLAKIIGASQCRGSAALIDCLLRRPNESAWNSSWTVNNAVCATVR